VGELQRRFGARQVFVTLNVTLIFVFSDESPVRGFGKCIIHYTHYCMFYSYRRPCSVKQINHNKRFILTAFDRRMHGTIAYGRTERSTLPGCSRLRSNIIKFYWLINVSLFHLEFFHHENYKVIVNDH